MLEGTIENIDFRTKLQNT